MNLYMCTCIILGARDHYVSVYYVHSCQPSTSNDWVSVVQYPRFSIINTNMFLSTTRAQMFTSLVSVHMWKKSRCVHDILSPYLINHYQSINQPSGGARREDELIKRRAIIERREAMRGGDSELLSCDEKLWNDWLSHVSFPHQCWHLLLHS